MEQFKRKKLNIAVKREFQRWLLVRIVGSVLVSALVAALVLYFYSRQELGESFYTAHITVRRVSDLLLPVILAGSAVSLISGVLLALFLPQKIAGPLYHVEKDLRRVADGDLTVKIVLREGDTLQDFAQLISQVINDLRLKIKAVQDSVAEITGTEGKDNQALLALKTELDKFKT